MKINFEDFDVKQCTPDCLGEILRIQDETLADLSSADILRENTPQMLEGCLAPPHYTVGAWHDGVLAAFAVLFYPGDDEENLSSYLESADVSGFKSANYKLCIVRKDYRGNALQYRLGQILERHAADRGAGILCATVSPRNPHSIKNVLRMGFVYDRTLSKYGFERNLYYKFLGEGGK